MSSARRWRVHRRTCTRSETNAHIFLHEPSNTGRTRRTVRAAVGQVNATQKRQGWVIVSFFYRHCFVFFSNISSTFWEMLKGWVQIKSSAGSSSSSSSSSSSVVLRPQLLLWSQKTAGRAMRSAELSIRAMMSPCWRIKARVTGSWHIRGKKGKKKIKKSFLQADFEAEKEINT